MVVFVLWNDSLIVDNNTFLRKHCIKCFLFMPTLHCELVFKYFKLCNLRKNIALIFPALPWSILFIWHSSAEKLGVSDMTFSNNCVGLRCHFRKLVGVIFISSCILSINFRSNIILCRFVSFHVYIHPLF